MSVAIRTVTIGKRSVKQITKVAKTYNLTIKEMYNKILEEWIKDHDDKYEIADPDTFIQRSVALKEELWLELSKLADTRNKSSSRLFAIVLDEWLSKRRREIVEC